MFLLLSIMHGLVFALLALQPPPTKDEAKKPPATKAAPPKEAMPEMMPGMEEVVMAWAKKRQAVFQKYPATELAKLNDAEREELASKLRAEMKQNDREMIVKVFAMVQKDPAHRGAAFGFWRIVGSDPHSTEGHESAELLLKHHPGHIHHLDTCLYFSYFPNAWTVSYLDKSVQSLKSVDDQARVKLFQANMYKQLAEVHGMLKYFDEKETRQFVELRGKETLDWYQQLDPKQLEAKATALYEEGLAQHANVKVESLRGVTIGKQAGQALHEMRFLNVGKPAQQIEGIDAEGKPMKLSDFKGKVVVLVFWGDWCRPCQAMIPYERGLVKRMEGKPFVLLGINSDPEREKLPDIAQKHGMTWRSWWDGGNTKGPIATAWNVQSWPTTYVIDQQGIIRAKQVREKSMDEAVDRLMKDAK